MKKIITRVGKFLIHGSTKQGSAITSRMSPQTEC